MRFAQRAAPEHGGSGFCPQSTQQVEVIEATTPQQAAVMLSEMVARYAIEVVSLSHWQTVGQYAQVYGITVVFREQAV